MIGSDDSFLCYLPSATGDKGGLTRENTPATFVVPLPRRVTLSPEWRVGLAEITTPTYYENIRAPWSQTIVARYPKKEFSGLPGGPATTTAQKRIRVKEGLYTPRSFAMAVNKELDRIAFPGPPPAFVPQKAFNGRLKYEENERKMIFYVKAGESIRVEPGPLRRMLGLSDDDPLEISHPFLPDGSKPKKANKILRPTGRCNFDINGGQMFVYADIVEYSMVGNTMAPLLRVVPIGLTEECSVRHREFTNAHYHRLKSKDFKSIEVQLCNAYGEPMPFSQGDSHLVLHFKRG